MTQLDIYKARIRAAKAELLTAGPIHARDLKKHIHRLEKELRIYIAYQKKAGGDTH